MTIKNQLFILILFLFFSTVMAAESESDFWLSISGIYGNGISGKSASIITTTQAGFIFVATEKGLFRSNDDGMTWEDISTGLPEFNFAHPQSSVITFAYIENHSIWAGTRSGLFQSADNGATWNQIAFQNQSIEAMAIDKDDNIFVFVRWGLAGFFRSNNYGKTWTKLCVDPNTGRSNKAPNSIFIGPQNSLFINETEATGVGSSFLSRSDDCGENWINVSPFHLCTHAFAFTSDNTIFIGTSKTPWPSNSPGPGVYKSTNLGDNWISLNPIVPDSNANYHVLTMAINSLGHIYCSNMSDNVVHRTTNEGNTWEEFGEAFNKNGIYSLAFDKNDYLYVGTGSSGLYRTIHNTTNVKAEFDHPLAKHEINIYPNPTNNKIVLNFKILKADYVTAKVYNMLGHEIMQITDQHYSAGSHQLIFQTINMATGLYIVQLKTTTFISNRKLSIIK